LTYYLAVVAAAVVAVAVVAVGAHLNDSVSLARAAAYVKRKGDPMPLECHTKAAASASPPVVASAEEVLPSAHIGPSHRYQVLAALEGQPHLCWHQYRRYLHLHLF